MKDEFIQRNRKAYFALLIVVSLLIFAACKIQYNTIIPVPAANETQQPTASEQAAQPVPCSNIPQQGQRDLCNYNLALNLNNATLCSIVNDYSIEMTCIQNVAKNLKNPNLCVVIHTDADRDQCYFGTAISANKFLVCTGILDYNLRHECYDKFNLTGMDVSTCGEIWNTDVKHECASLIEKANS